MIKVIVTGISGFVGHRLVFEIDFFNKKNMDVLVVF